MPDYVIEYEAAFGQRTFGCVVRYSVEMEAPLPDDRLLVESVHVTDETYRSSKDGRLLIEVAPFGEGEELVVEALSEMVALCREKEIERKCWTDFHKRKGHEL
jgi:hypothetical protein